MAILNSQFLFFRGRSLSVKLYRYPPKSLMTNEIVCWVTIWSLLFSVPFQMKHNFQGGANRNESLPAAANQQQNHEGHRWEILVRQPVSALHLQTQSGKRRDLHRWQIHEVLSHTPTEPLDCGRGQECAAWTGKFGYCAFIWFDAFFSNIYIYRKFAGFGENQKRVGERVRCFWVAIQHEWPRGHRCKDAGRGKALLRGDARLQKDKTTQRVRNSLISRNKKKLSTFRIEYIETLQKLEDEMNRTMKDVKVRELTRVKREEAEKMAVGADGENVIRSLL